MEPLDFKPVKLSKANFSHMFPIVTGTVISKYQNQYEHVEATFIDCQLDLDCKIEVLEEGVRAIVRPVRIRAIK